MLPQGDVVLQGRLRSEVDELVTKRFATTMIQCVVSYIMEARRWLRSQQIGYASERFGRASERFSEQGSLYPGSPGQRTVSVGEEAASESR